VSKAPKVLRHRTDYADHRRAGYPPIGDQLDAVMKIARALAAQGIQLPPDAMAVVEKCEAVKARYRKPPEGESNG
jgi:hypothetical protein